MATPGTNAVVAKGEKMKAIDWWGGVAGGAIQVKKEFCYTQGSKVKGPKAQRLCGAACNLEIIVGSR